MTDLVDLVNESEVYFEVYDKDNNPLYVKLKEIKDDSNLENVFSYDNRKYIFEVVEGFDATGFETETRRPARFLMLEKLFQTSLEYGNAFKDKQGAENYPLVLIRHDAFTRSIDLGTKRDGSWKDIDDAWKEQSYDKVMPLIFKKLIEDKHIGSYTIGAKYN